MDIYREHILEHYQNPRGYGVMEQADTEAQGLNPLCGDQLTVQLKITNKTITRMSFTGHGCAISIATSSLLSEFVVSKTLEAIKDLSRSDIEALLGTSLPPARLKCGLLPLETIQLACAKLT